MNKELRVSDEDRLWWLDIEDILASYIISQFLALSEYEILSHVKCLKVFKALLWRGLQKNEQQKKTCLRACG